MRRRRARGCPLLLSPFRIQPLSPLHATTIIRISGLFSPRKRGIGNDEERRRITGENRATSDDRATFADDLDDWTNRRYRKSIITGLKSPVVVSFSPSLRRSPLLALGHCHGHFQLQVSSRRFLSASRLARSLVVPFYRSTHSSSSSFFILLLSPATFLPFTRPVETRLTVANLITP